MGTFNLSKKTLAKTFKVSHQTRNNYSSLLISVAEPEPPLFDPVGAGAAKKSPAPAPIVPQKLKTVGNRCFNFK